MRKKYHPRRLQKAEQGWGPYIIKAFLCCAIFYIVFHYILGLSIIMGNSMAPTYHDKEPMLFSRVSDVDRGDVVVIDSDKIGLIIKRVVAVPGNTISIENGQTYLNGEPLDEPYVVHRDETDYMEEIAVPEGYYFVMGDNRPTSMDSRSWVSLIPEDEVIGVAVFP